MPSQSKKDSPRNDRSFDVEEIRLISDLRIMHSKVDELFQIVKNLRDRHHESDIYRYADSLVMDQNIEHIDEIYLWFVKIKEERDRANQQ